MNICKYSLFMIHPTPDRLDQVVAGAIFFDGESWDVRVGSDLHKMLAIDPSFKEQRLLQVKNFLFDICNHANGIDMVRENVRICGASVYVHEGVEAFFYQDDEHYEQQVRSVLHESVDVARVKVARRPRNRVRRDLRTKFQALSLWSKHDSDIEHHRVVEQFLLSPEHGIVAEFALRNGAMHITETIDFSLHTATAKRLEAQAKTLVLDEATRVFGDSTKKYVVAAGASIVDMRASVRLLEDRATLFSSESSADMQAYFDLISSAAANQPLI